jgi:transcription antitermination factor NusG
MPILKREQDLYPGDLLEPSGYAAAHSGHWWALYTLSRREKELMRRLVQLQIPFYGPVIETQHRSPAGRLRTSFLPIFSNYVFVFGTDDQRYTAMTTGCVSRHIEVPDSQALLRDLRQLQSLIGTGIDLTPEARIEPGARVRVRSGVLTGQVGTVIERRGKRRLLVAVDFLQQGASAELETCDIEPFDE